MYLFCFSQKVLAIYYCVLVAVQEGEQVVVMTLIDGEVLRLFIIRGLHACSVHRVLPLAPQINAVFLFDKFVKSCSLLLHHKILYFEEMFNVDRLVRGSVFKILLITSAIIRGTEISSLRRHK